jgi:polyisoprenoid-binding protein YceI
MHTITEPHTIVPAGTWAVDPVHSQVGFAIGYVGGTFRGSFAPVEALLEVADDGSTTLVGTARAESVKVLDENLEAHLLSPEFFDAEREPTLTFTSTSTRREGDEVVVEGDLVVKGHSEPVVLRGTIGGPVTDPYGRERITATLAGKVDRTRFGLDWNMPLPSGEPALANEVDLSAELYLVHA